MLVGIGQGGPAGSGNAQVLELPFTASEPSGDLPEGMGSAQLAKEHGDKLPPAGEAAGMTFGLGLVHGLLELDPRNHCKSWLNRLQNRFTDGPLLVVEWVSEQNPFTTNPWEGLFTSRSLIWTRVMRSLFSSTPPNGQAYI